MTDETEMQDALFVNLVLIFQGAAMQQMGKIINPLTGKVEKNLEQARFSIDTLAMLREKTRGNLSLDLERLLDSTLLNLRMNYVEEAAQQPPTGEEASGVEGAAPSGETVTGAVTKGGNSDVEARDRAGTKGGTEAKGEAAASGTKKAKPKPGPGRPPRKKVA